MVFIHARTFTITLLLPIPSAKAISKTGTAANYNTSTEPDCAPWERWRPAGGLENRLSQRTASRRDASAPRK